jgi:TatD DNase family protein
MFIDSHAHIFFKDFQPDLPEVIRRAQDAGVEAIVCPGTDLETSRQSIALAEEYGMVYACVGFHPHDASKGDATALNEIERLSEHPKVVAIGEIGLDFHYNFSPPERQMEVFSEQIRIAQRRNLPIVIHSRKAEADTMRIVEGAIIESPGWRPAAAPRGVFHCFPGDVAMANRVIGWNFCISVPGPVTFGSKPGRPNLMAEVVEKTSLDHMLIETDSPYLTPAPHRGTRNEPAHVRLIAGVIAGIKGRTPEEVGASTTAAARRLFGIH